MDGPDGDNVGRTAEMVIRETTCITRRGRGERERGTADREVCSHGRCRLLHPNPCPLPRLSHPPGSLRWGSAPPLIGRSLSPPGKAGGELAHHDVQVE
ncbi:hypothetical protein B296_00028597 [Ensete ventricosum]|uniref:Uncharacterized protein n=1 Tax=Ensete ventricosum TaxID=4639 RepID=A0A426Z072_ENSVE|nr:hypothetical protein B296_00028597 [Ensete ventricosum]